MHTMRDVAGFYPAKLLVEGAHWRRRAFWCRRHGLKPSPADATLVFQGHGHDRMEHFNRRHRLAQRLFDRPFLFDAGRGDYVLTTQPYNAENDLASLDVMRAWAAPLGLVVQDRFAESWWWPGSTAHYVIARPDVVARLRDAPAA
ncbi:hypothetical protein [Salinarimonas soli]|uniref:Uncharacterized protein n=1 Tax=Salinarimonas soli TaxID=1638099 RepID=A0A5B2VBD5_9HYPH|nr:hypothetical protein [Salinarimonas soli]KAA2236038.1 hypothetical protein F0L46_16830 [Salinarimonas soli]